MNNINTLYEYIINLYIIQKYTLPPLRAHAFGPKISRNSSSSSSSSSSSTPSPPTKSLDFGGFDSGKLLVLKGGNAHVR